ncbi:hypothetical protein [Propylenella binzhouense]|uniref:Uncharacterized protein n=1 Tax=Propylenella binzhouense TaxID=2555902 RepID=A0A964T151_9HYPH|nr:hypothetical protein [Propylenella binzhouense]MYZ46468.1 hypothetical protein [Propylenella binzhouense]
MIRLLEAELPADPTPFDVLHRGDLDAAPGEEITATIADTGETVELVLIASHVIGYSTLIAAAADPIAIKADLIARYGDVNGGDTITVANVVREFGA